MSREILLLTFLAVAACTVGCEKPEAASQRRDEAGVKTTEMAQDMNDYSATQKTEFMEKMRGQLTEINHDLDQLTAKIERSSDAVQAEAKPKLKALRDQTAWLTKQLEEVKNVRESTFENVKTGYKTAHNDSKDGFNQSRQWASEKVAP